MPITVTLTEAEYARAVNEGNARTNNCLTRGYKDKHGAEQLGAARGRDISVLGCLGETAAAKSLGLAWTPGSFHDLGADGVGDFEIRTTERHSNSLIVRPDDHDERIYILVTTEDPQRRTFTVQGWYPCRGAKLRTEFKRAPNGRPAAWFIPASALIDMRFLPKSSVPNIAA